MYKKMLIFLILALFFLSSPSVVTAIQSPTVDVFRLTYGFYREDWPVIYKNKVLWIAEGIIYVYDVETKMTYPFFEGEQPLVNLYGLVGYDGKYIIYISNTDESSLDVSAYDVEEGNNILITDKPGSQGATDYDHRTVIYIDGGPCGKLLTYNLSNKSSVTITKNACYAKISGNTVVWSYGDSIYEYDLVRDTNFTVTTNGGHPDIYGDNVVWLSIEEGKTNVYLKNIKTGQEKRLLQTSTYGITWPAISQRYVIWGKTTAPDIAGVEGVDLLTREVFEIQEQGSHQNGVIAPQLEGNIAAWMAWRTGNGDIYAAVISTPDGD